MIVAFANNQTLVTDDSKGVVTIYTDPVPMNGNDRASAICNVHYLFGGTSRELAWYGEMSNDGIEYAAVSGLQQTAIITEAVQTPVSATVAGGFIRFRYEFEITGGSGTGAVCFDLHVRLDHQ